VSNHIAENLLHVQHSILRSAEKAGRDVADIKLIAVLKTR